MDAVFTVVTMMVYLPTGCWRTHRGQMYNSKGEYFDMDIGDGLGVYEQEK